VGGLGLAGLERSGLGSLLGSETRVVAEDFLRPPGALPETAFLARCLRCGLCLRVCPTNGLQPAWLAAGPGGVFTPVLLPRRGPCEPDCNLCGRVCPTGALASLDLAEKRWAKIGGAVVHNNRCLAWAEGKSCLVCQEVCPYGAIEMVWADGGAGVPAPLVKAHKCFGCGYCEMHCPARVPAITVHPLNALRLAGSGSVCRDTASGRVFREGHGPESTPLAENLPALSDYKLLPLPFNPPVGDLPTGFSD
jgi:MauM/NapG family ferredoxin protein